MRNRSETNDSATSRRAAQWPLPGNGPAAARADVLPSHELYTRGSRRGEKRKSASDHDEYGGSSSSASEDDTAHINGNTGGSVNAMMALLQSVQRASAEERGRSSEHFESLQAIKKSQKKGSQQPEKKRKPTHTVRKEEIAVLTEEMHLLEQRLEFLRGEAFALPSTHEPEHPHIPNTLLREAIHEQQLSLACARSMISQYFTEDYALPAHYYIHLTKSKFERQKALRIIKPQQLRVARRYVLERSRHLNLTKPHASGERFINQNGDAVNIRFRLVQFHGQVTVREIYEAASFYTSNLEISYTDGAGRVTIREQEDDTDEPTISQHHFLTTVSEETGVLMEGNLAMFSHFDDQEDYGIFTSTFVDRDDLHPYQTSERIRQDVTAVLMISREKDMVVMRRMAHVRVHHNDAFPVGDELLQALSEGVSQWGDALVKHAKDRFGILS